MPNDNNISSLFWRLWKDEMKNNSVLKKVICLVLIAGIICASIAVMTACGKNKSFKDYYGNDGESSHSKSYALKKNVSYVIEIADSATGLHDLYIKIDGKSQNVVIETAKATVLNGLTAESFGQKVIASIGSNNEYRYENGKNANSYRIKITPSCDCNLSYVLTRL